MSSETKRRYFRELRISQLRAIIALARGKGFAGAASELRLTTPSVWQQVRGLESEFDVPLVEVEGQQVRLTKQGELLVELSKPIVHGFDSLREQFSSQLQGEAQKLVLAAPNDLLVNELPEPMRKYRQEFPNVSLSLIDSASNPARRLLEENQVDLAVVGQLDLDLPTSLGVDKITSFPFTLVCPKSHPLLSLATVEPHDLAKYPLVMPSNGTNARRRANEIFSAAGLTETLRVAFETSTKELLLKYVQMEFGIGIAPISPYTIADCERHAAHVAFRDLSDSFGSEHVVILRRLGRREPEHQRALRMAILDAICN